VLPEYHIDAKTISVLNVTKVVVLQLKMPGKYLKFLC